MEQLVTIGQTPRTPTLADKVMEMAREEAQELARLRRAAIAAASTTRAKATASN